MNDAILIQQSTPGGGPYELVEYPQMVELCRQWHMDYAAQHNFDTQIIVGYVEPVRPLTTGAWAKVELIRQALDKGYRYVVWIDPDVIIWDLSVDLRDGCPKGIGACWHRIPQLDHWNTGALFVQNTPETRKFIADWLNNYSEINMGWGEQGIFNRLAMKGRVVETISDKWNATVDVNMVPDAVVMGFHGGWSAREKLNAMKAAFEIAQRAGMEPRLAEVQNG